MLLLRPRPRSLLGVVALVLLVSLLAGVLVRQLIERSRLPIERARELAHGGLYADAEHLYLEIALPGPASLPTLVELLDNHRRLLVVSSRALLAAGASSAIEALAVTSGERRIDALLDAPDLPLDVAALARWWNKVTHGRANERDRDRIAAIADGDSPAPWSNHLLGREAQADDRDEDAAERFAHEATAFDDRREDASAACNQWIDDGNWQRLTRALEAIGLLWERWRVRLPMYLGAMVLGVASTYVTMAVAMAEHAYGFAEKGHAVLDAIYFVVGVGLREELSKALLLLPLVPIVKRWGRRREALACGALVGLGFAVAENVGYFHMGLSTALARFLTANFLHVSTTALLAVAIDDYVRGREAQSGDLSRTLMVVVAAHGLYDFFLSSPSVGAGSFMAMLVFVLLTRRFVDVLRHLPGREGPLLEWFGVGLAVVAGASFVYACTLVAPWQAAAALLEGAAPVGSIASGPYGARVSGWLRGRRWSGVIIGAAQRPPSPPPPRRNVARRAPSPPSRPAWDAENVERGSTFHPDRRADRRDCRDRRSRPWQVQRRSRRRRHMRRRRRRERQPRSLRPSQRNQQRSLPRNQQSRPRRPRRSRRRRRSRRKNLSVRPRRRLCVGRPRRLRTRCATAWRGRGFGSSSPAASSTRASKSAAAMARWRLSRTPGCRRSSRRETFSRQPTKREPLDTYERSHVSARIADDLHALRRCVNQRIVGCKHTSSETGTAEYFRCTVPYPCFVAVSVTGMTRVASSI